jgi:hypothetical protein
MGLSTGTTLPFTKSQQQGVSREMESSGVVAQAHRLAAHLSGPPHTLDHPARRDARFGPPAHRCLHPAPISRAVQCTQSTVFTSLAAKLIGICWNWGHCHHRSSLVFASTRFELQLGHPLNSLIQENYTTGSLIHPYSFVTSPLLVQ